MAKQFEGQILTPFDMTMGIMSVYICAAIAYNPREALCEVVSIRSVYVRDVVHYGFLLIAAPKTKGTMPVDSPVGRGFSPLSRWRFTVLK